MLLPASWEDTIVALATPNGMGAIGVVRLSGTKAVGIADVLFPSKNLSTAKTHTAHVGFLIDQGMAIDEVVLTLFKAPRSYTGEDVVEISGHGSPFILQQIINACISKGARLAQPGEFTLRAFLKGKLDLAQAEAVADIIASDTAAAQQTALQHIRGGFSSVLKELREELIQFAALIELELDFSEEDVAFADRDKLSLLLNHLLQTTHQLLQSFQLGNVIKNGVQVAIVGKPNAGKSTLLNTLLNENRAIVSEMPGTTRDAIEEVLNINGILFRLIDTAGIREETMDVIENMGIQKSLEKVKTADIVLYLFDLSTTSLTDLEKEVRKYFTPASHWILCGTKQDLLHPTHATAWADELKIIQQQFNAPDFVPISAKQNLHIDVLKNTLSKKYNATQQLQNTTIVTNVRHYQALQQLHQALQEVQKGVTEKLSSDLLALDIRRCLQYLGEITGEITNEDQLDYIFSKFCIGK
jgi:tRNA modification GTPase